MVGRSVGDVRVCGLLGRSVVWSVMFGTVGRSGRSVGRTCSGVCGSVSSARSVGRVGRSVGRPGCVGRSVSVGRFGSVRSIGRVGRSVVGRSGMPSSNPCLRPFSHFSHPEGATFESKPLLCRCPPHAVVLALPSSFLLFFPPRRGHFRKHTLSLPTSSPCRCPGSAFVLSFISPPCQGDFRK